MKFDKRQRLLLVIAVSALALFVTDKLLLTPLSHTWNDRAQEIVQLRTQVADGTALIRRADAIHKRWNDIRDNTLPDNPSLAQEQVLKAVVNWAQESGAGLNAITPQWKTDSADHKNLVCRIDASGTLWILSRFLYDLEKSPLALKLESVDLSSRDNNGQQLTLGLQISGLALPASP